MVNLKSLSLAAARAAAGFNPRATMIEAPTPGPVAAVARQGLFGWVDSDGAQTCFGLVPDGNETVDMTWSTGHA